MPPDIRLRMSCVLVGVIRRGCMLCQSGGAQGLAPGQGVRRVSVLKSLTAVSLLALGGAAAMGPAQAADIFDGNVDGRDGRGEFSRGEFLGPVHLNWSGIYVGGHFGGAWGGVDLTG